MPPHPTQVFLISCFLLAMAGAASVPAGATEGSPAACRAAEALDGYLSLARPWCFQPGDDPSWSDPRFDDAGWPTIEVPGTWAEAGFGDPRSGWYRLHLALPDGGGQRLAVRLGRVFSAYELYADGQLIGGVGGLPPTPRMEYDRLAVWPLPRELLADGEVVLALRVHADAAEPGDGGISDDLLAIGPADDLLVELARHDLVRLLLASIFLATGLYHLFLFRRRPRLRVYLWFGLFSVLYAVYALLSSQWRFELTDDWALLKRFELALVMLVPPLAVRFLALLVDTPIRRWLDLYLNSHLALAALALLAPTDLGFQLALLRWWLPWAVIGLAWSTWAVLRAWHDGHPEGRIVGIGFLVAAASFLYDLGVGAGWLPPPLVGTYGFAAFLVSMVMSLANRFTRVHRQLDQLRLGLEQRVASRTTELAEARDAAEAASAAKSRFLANMSHEIRTPMNGVLGLVDLLGQTELEPRQKKFVDTIQSSAVTLMRILDDVLDLSRIDAGSLTLEPEAVDLPELARSVVALIRPYAENKGLTLELSLDEALPQWIVADPVRLRQILLNLLNNAVKFTDDGSVELELERITSGIRLSVTDTGIGMGQDTTTRIFRPFEQGDASTHRRFGGTGLGLAISRRLVEAAGGSIQVLTVQDEGTTFIVELPVEATEAPPDGTGEISTSTAYADRLILLVEDDPVNQLVASEHLELLGIDHELASDGQAALARLDAGGIDLVLMDCQMPIIDGYQASRRWRRREAAAGDGRLPIIAVTAHAIDGERERCLDAGMDDFITKPYRSEDLARLFDRWLLGRVSSTSTP